MKYKVNEAIASDILQEMPEQKKQVLRNCCFRNFCFTSEYVPSMLVLEIYKEGFRLVIEGCQCSFSVWAFDDDGAFRFDRMPSRKSLHLIYTDDNHGSMSNNLYEQIYNI